MGCCQSVAKDESFHVPSRPRSQTPIPPSATDICYPDKAGHGGIKVFASSASASGSNGNGSRAYTRLIVGSDWMFAALFEAHGCNSEGPADGDAAARFCAEQCYTEFLRAAGDAAVNGSSGVDVRSSLMETLRVLDRRLLKSSELAPQDRMTSGCTAVLLHLTLGPERVATAASVGPCAAVVGQRRGGLASATSAPLVLCGGQATSHHALRDFTAALATELGLPEPRTSSRGGAPSGSRKRLRMRLSGSGASEDLVHARQQSWVVAGGAQLPQYSHDVAAPQALGFGSAKGMGWRASAGGAAGPPARPRPRVGLEVQTARKALVPGDECVVLLSGGAMAAITPTDVALLMHRMGHLSAIPYESKARPLPVVPSPMSSGSGAAVQLDSQGAVGPRPMAPYSGGGAVPPFNAAKLLVQHAAAAAAARKRQQPGAGRPPVCSVMALALDWPSSSGGDTAAAAAACGAAVPAVCAAAAAAARDRRRAQYLWQLLRMYYKFPYKRKVATINRWHELFDRVVGEAMREARSKEVTAWKRLGAVLQVSAAGNVRSVAPQPSSPSLQPNYFRSPRSQYHQSPRSLSARQRSPRPSATSGQYGTPQQPSPVAASNSARYRSSPRNGPGASPGRPSYGSPSVTASNGARSNRSPLTGGIPSASRVPAAAGANATGVMSPSAATAAAASGAVDTDGVRVQVSSTTKTPRPPLGPGARSASATPRSLATPGAGSTSALQIQQQHPSQQPQPQQPPPATPRSSTSARALTRDPDSTPYTSARQHSSRPGTDRCSGIPTPTAATAASPKPNVLPVPEPDTEPEHDDDVITGIGGDGIVTITSGRSYSGNPAKTDGGAAAPAADGASGAAPTPCPRISLISSNLVALDTAASAPAVAPAPSVTLVVAHGAASSHIPSVPAAIAATSSGGGAAPPSARPTSGAARSSIPTLQLQPGSGTPGQAATHTTPRLSAPGGISSALPIPPFATTPTRKNNTWGGAPSTTTPTTTGAAAPLSGSTSARTGGASRLPRPGRMASPLASPKLQTAPTARTAPPSRTQSFGSVAGGAHGTAAPSPSAAPSTRPGASSRVLAAVGTELRPPQLNTNLEPIPPSEAAGPAAQAAVAGVVAAAAPAGRGPLPASAHTSAGGGGDFDLLSPDADQLAAWALEAADAIIASPSQPSPRPSQQQQSQQRTTAQGAAAGGSGGRGGSRGISGIASPAAATAATGHGGGGGGTSRPAMASRIPLSPRDENNPSPRTTPRALSGDKSSSALLGRTASTGNSGTPRGGVGAAEPAAQPLRTSSLRARR